MPSVAPPSGGWVSVHEASALLGIAVTTLRRWGDAGLVPMKRTLGGHRRFPLDALRQMAASATAETAPVAPGADHAVVAPAESRRRRWGLDRDDLVRQGWYSHLTAEPGVGQMRGLGQRLLGLLIQYINRREDDERFLTEAGSVGTMYGRQARGAGLGMRELIQAYLFFRETFARSALPLPGIPQPTDLAEMASLHLRINRFMDAILVGLVDGYETATP